MTWWSTMAPAGPRTPSQRTPCTPAPSSGRGTRRAAPPWARTQSCRRRLLLISSVPLVLVEEVLCGLQPQKVVVPFDLQWPMQVVPFYPQPQRVVVPCLLQPQKVVVPSVLQLQILEVLKVPLLFLREVPSGFLPPHLQLQMAPSVLHLLAVVVMVALTVLMPPSNTSEH